MSMIRFVPPTYLSPPHPNGADSQIGVHGVVVVGEKVYSDFQPFYDLGSAEHVRRVIEEDRGKVEREKTQMFSFVSEGGRVRRTSQGGPFDGS